MDLNVLIQNRKKLYNSKRKVGLQGQTKSRQKHYIIQS